jgi:hypothetical protein
MRFGDCTHDEFCRRADRLLEEVGKLETRFPMPLHWNFPVKPVLEKQSRNMTDLLEEIRRRVTQHQDIIVPGGFTGSPHPLMLSEELERELLWCYKNPWFPGLKKLFGLEPDFILPICPDLLAEAASSDYSRRGFRVIGVPVSLHRLKPRAARRIRVYLESFADSAYTIAGSRSKVLLQPVVVVRSANEASEAIASRKTNTLFVLFDPWQGRIQSEPPGAGTLGPLIELLTRHRKIDFLSFREKPPKKLPASVDPADLLNFVEPYGRHDEQAVWAQVENLRKKKRKTNKQLCFILESLAGADPNNGLKDSQATVEAVKDELEITNVSMAGSVALIGATVQATFVEGRFSNLAKRGTEVLAGKPAQSYLTVGTKRVDLRTESAFSFERDGQAGLRSTLSARIGEESKPIRVVLEHYFEGDDPTLRLDIGVHYPLIPDALLHESAPLEICLFSFTQDDSLLIEVELANGSLLSEAITHQEMLKRLYGKKFRIVKQDKAVQLTAAPAYKTRTEQIEFQVRKRRGGYLLFANLGGSYLPQTAGIITNRKHMFSYGIGLPG